MNARARQAIPLVGPASAGTFHDGLDEWLGRFAAIEANEQHREQILSELYYATACCVRGATVVARFQGGIALMRALRVGSELAPVVSFEVVYDGTERRLCFWFNKSSVVALGEHLRKLPRLPVSEIVL